MAKKKPRKAYTSTGSMKSISSSNLIKPSETTVIDKEIHKVRALNKGMSVWFTMENPDKNNTKEKNGSCKNAFG